MLDIFFNMLRKVLVGTILIIFAFFVLYVPQPFNQIERAQAGLPVAEEGPSLAKDIVLDGIANALAKSFVSAITASIVQWISSGFKGSPAFISNFEGFMLDVADQAAGDFIANKIGTFVCSPFRLDIQIALSLKYQASRVDEYRGCRLSEMVGNIEDFLAGEFSQGGWADWFRITADPMTYTPYGQLLEADARMQASIRNAEGQEMRIAGWGDGFLSGKICEAIEGPGAAAPSGAASGGSASGNISGGVNLGGATPSPGITTGGAPSGGSASGGTTAAPTQANPAQAAGAAVGAAARAAVANTAAPTPKKEKCVITKPGTVVVDSLKKVLGSGVDSLIAADEINEIVSALLSQIAVQAVTGATGLLGLSARTQGVGSGGSYLDQMNQATLNQIRVAGAENLNTMTSAASVQSRYIQLANQYSPRLQAYIANRDNSVERRNAATTAWNQTRQVRERAQSNLERINSLIESYRGLDTELQATASSSIQLQQSIKQRQAAVITAFYQISAYTENDIQASRETWEATMRP